MSKQCISINESDVIEVNFIDPEASGSQCGNFVAVGANPFSLISAASTNATNVKSSPGKIFMISATNRNANPRYLKLYNKATAPTVGTDAPVFTFMIPGNSSGTGTNVAVPAVGLRFSAGISFALTTEPEASGATGVAALEVIVNLGYI